jgi:hypothetical protein
MHEIWYEWWLYDNVLDIVQSLAKKKSRDTRGNLLNSECQVASAPSCTARVTGVCVSNIETPICISVLKVVSLKILPY